MEIALMHKVRQQSCSLGRFAVCSCQWRSGTGDRAQVDEQVTAHLRLVGAVL